MDLLMTACKRDNSMWRGSGLTSCILETNDTSPLSKEQSGERYSIEITMVTKL